jgi:NaMN:DMB phosphoribosyltransferase
MKNPGVKTIKSKYGNSNPSHFKSKKSSFLFTLSYTETATIPGLTIAGANTELTKFTPAADAEYIHFGKCKCIDSIPATPDGKPTPAIITINICRSKYTSMCFSSLKLKAFSAAELKMVVAIS